MKQRILWVEDDREIGKMVQYALEHEGYHVDYATDGEEALQRFSNQPTYHLLILDIMLPRLDGLEVLKRVRRTSVVPVLLLSAKDKETDKALGLGFGADDYLAKPFSMVELLARVQAAIRRATLYTQQQLVPPEQLSHRELVMDLEQHAVTKRGVSIKLTAKEFQILKLFLQAPKRVYTKEMIYQAVWREAFYGDENVVNVHISRLRDKIEDDTSHPPYIETLWGIGYRLGGG